MNNSIGNTIKTHRKQNGMLQKTLSKRLTEYGIHITNAAISSWEKDATGPSAYQLLAVCEILGISDIYTEFIGPNPLDPFAGLNQAGREKALEYIDLLKDSVKYQEQTPDVIPFPSRRMKIALIPTSAGTGEYLGDEYFEEIDVYDPVPSKADFGVYISGDSMEPRFHNDELVWIEKTDQLDTDDIGLFYYDGMTYFKKFLKNDVGTFLISLNPNYKPIQIGEYSAFKIFGRLATL